jgi:CDP-diacylglycerol--serine O-phosphatidyltransferase
MNKSDVVPDELPADLATDAPQPRRRRRILRLSTLPTALTVGNLVCGILAIAYVGDASAQYALVAILDGGAAATASTQAAVLMERAGWLIMLGMLFDGLDGRVARMVRSTSEFGGALDSLADVVTFGVAPALVAKTLMEGALTSVDTRMTFLTAAFFAVCACLRLARYNAEHEEETAAVDHFTGIPTPGAAGVIAGVAMVHARFLEYVPDERWKLATSYVIGFGVLTGLGLLMVSRVPYVHFANKFLRGKRSVGKISLLFLVMMLALNFDLSLVLAVGFAGYAASGPLAFLVRVARGRREEIPEIFD